MSTNKITVQCEDIHSSQEWAADPDLIEIYLSKTLLEKAEKCVAFMQENDVDYMSIWFSLGYELLQNVDNVDESEVEDKKVTDFKGEQFVAFEPEYSLEGCHTKIYKDGQIDAILPFKHSAGALSCVVGMLPKLKAQFANASVASPQSNQESEQVE